MLLKAPFGVALARYVGKPGANSSHTWLQWLVSGQWSGLILLAGLGGLLLYGSSGLRASPLLERLMFRNARQGARPIGWRPGLIAGVVSLLVGVIISAIRGFVTPANHRPRTLGVHASHAVAMHLIALWPSGVVGAALSEEVVFRFGAIATLMGLLSFVHLRGWRPSTNVIFWIANIAQGAWFGFVHVHEGLVVSSLGYGVLLAIAIAPQTWAGFVFGYVFRRWGIEAAIVAHMVVDTVGPLLLVLSGGAHF
ncbi:MAG: CPBP family glutamic-type intramembrane protease [Steroidobacteraceae bacterium]